MENVGTLDVIIVRQGYLTKPSSIKVQSIPSENPKEATGLKTELLSAHSSITSVLILTETIDYVNVDKVIEFSAGQDKYPLTVTIVNDDSNPIKEGLESFNLVFKESTNAVIIPYEETKIIIDDEKEDGKLDILSFYFHIS